MPADPLWRPPCSGHLNPGLCVWLHHRCTRPVKCCTLWVKKSLFLLGHLQCRRLSSPFCRFPSSFLRGFNEPLCATRWNGVTCTEWGFDPFCGCRWIFSLCSEVHASSLLVKWPGSDPGGCGTRPQTEKCIHRIHLCISHTPPIPDAPSILPFLCQVVLKKKSYPGKGAPLLLVLNFRTKMCVLYTSGYGTSLCCKAQNFYHSDASNTLEFSSTRGSTQIYMYMYRLTGA